MLPVSELSKVAIRLPPGFPQGLDVVLIQDGAGNSRVGVTDEAIALTPLTDVSRLYEIERIARKCENEMARGQKVVLAQRILFDNTEGKVSEAAMPAEDFQSAAADSIEITRNLEKVSTSLDQITAVSGEEKQVKAFVMSEMNVMSGVAKNWLTQKSLGRKTSKSLFSAFKEERISAWLVNRVCGNTVPVFKNWTNFLFPKDMSKGIKMTREEFERALSRPGGVFFNSSKIVFELVETLGKTKEKKDDKKASHLLIPRVSLDSLAGRIKAHKVEVVSEELRLVLDLLYRASRLVLPLKEENKKDALGVLFKDPVYDPDALKTPLQQLLEKPGQKFLFWNRVYDGSIVVKLFAPFGLPSNMESLKKAISPSPPDEEKENYDPPDVERRINLVGPQIQSDNPEFLEFQKKLKSLHLLQPPKAKKNQPMGYRSYVPTKETKELLDLVRSQARYIPIRDQVDRFINSFEVDDIRNGAAKRLGIILSNIEKPRVEVPGFAFFELADQQPESDAPKDVVGSDEEEEVPDQEE